MSKKDLKNNPLLKELTDEELKQVINVLKPKKVEAGKIIVEEGEEGDSLFLFEDGEVEVISTLTLDYGGAMGQAEKSMARLDGKHIGFFGEMSLLTQAPRSATIRAITDCKLYELKKSDFEELSKQNPEIGYKLVKKMAQVMANRLRKMNSDILKLTTALSIALSKMAKKKKK